jgi:hypothetical protein
MEHLEENFYCRQNQPIKLNYTLKFYKLSNDDVLWMLTDVSVPTGGKAVDKKHVVVLKYKGLPI